MVKTKTKYSLNLLPKCLTGIQGFDEITGGGLPQGRPTLVCGGAGCGKTLFSMEFIVNGALHFNEPGVYMAFEESEDDLVKNVASLGFDLNNLIKQRKVLLDHVLVERSEIEETGEYDLEGLFIRLQNAIDSIGAKRVVLDTIEALFSGFMNENILRAEIRRLLRWLKDKGVSSIVTGESGVKTLTRHGLEEYIADCVIMLDHRVTEQMSTRRMRIVKYRGSTHGTNEYPFLIDEKGFSVLPVTSLGLEYKVGRERITTGVKKLDAMLGGKGYYRGSSILVSGTAGTGKSSVAACLADSACRNGERCLYVATEESKSQIMRNMNSIGIDLEQWERKGLLHFQNVRPTFYGLEMHLIEIHKKANMVNPSVLILDPISNLTSVSKEADVKAMLTRLLDFLKMKNITSIFTNLVTGALTESTEVGVSSLMDTWIQLRDMETGGERNRLVYVLKSRGMSHSNQVREFLISDKGIELQQVYLGTGEVFTGSMKAVQEAKDKAEAMLRKQNIDRMKLELEQKKKAMEAETEKIRTAYLTEVKALEQEIMKDKVLEESIAHMAKLRYADKGENR